MKKERKHYTAEEKVAILRRHLLDKVPVSDLCEELGLQPTVFYRWQKEFFENGAAAFQTSERPRRQAEEKQKRIEFLEKKVRTARKKPSDDRPPCLENPRPEGAESTLTENAPSPFHAEPRQSRLIVRIADDHRKRDHRCGVKW